MEYLDRIMIAFAIFLRCGLNLRHIIFERLLLLFAQEREHTLLANLVPLTRLRDQRERAPHLSFNG